jgi:hypothetical protein
MSISSKAVRSAYEISILYLSHRCYALMIGEENTETTFVDDFMELLGIQQKDCQAFYQEIILPALLKNKKRLPEKISILVHEQALELYPALVRPNRRLAVAPFSGLKKSKRSCRTRVALYCQ